MLYTAFATSLGVLMPVVIVVVFAVVVGKWILGFLAAFDLCSLKKCSFL
jgi:hypothetical protein